MLKPVTTTSGVPSAGVDGGFHWVAASAGETKCSTGVFASAKPAVVPPTTRTSTPAIPTGATGNARGTRRRWSTASTTCSQSQAFAMPASAATGTRAHAGHVVMTLPNTDNATNATRTQPRLRAESVRRHHDSVTAAPCRRRASMSTTGIATKKSHDNDTTARANMSATHGASNTPAMSVNNTLRRIVSAHGSSARSCGHAARRQTAVSRLRNPRNARSSPARPNQLSW